MKDFFERFQYNYIHTENPELDIQNVRDGILFLNSSNNLIFVMENGVSVYIDNEVTAYCSDTGDRVWYIKGKDRDRVYRKSLVYVDEAVDGIFTEDGGFLFTENGMAFFEDDAGRISKLLPSECIPILNK